MTRIVLTGGPGAGKTSSLEYIKSKLECHGRKVLVVPEIATMLFNGGVDLRVKGDKLAALQANMARSQLTLENVFSQIAESMDDDVVIIHDRGAMDPKAFMPEDIWYRVVELDEHSESWMRDRYDAVIHLATPSDEFYTTENNPARAESGKAARELDERIKEAWVGHPHLRVIDSCSDFKQKMRNALEAIYRVVGIPEPLEIERKYLVTSYGDWTVINVPVKYIDALIEQVYLKDHSRIRARSQGSTTIYTHTIKGDISDVKRTEVERRITEGEYRLLMAERSQSHRLIKKIRRSFLWRNQYFELDIFIEPHKHLTLLEIELEHEDQEIFLPPFIGVDREVTGEKQFTNANLARIT